MNKNETKKGFPYNWDQEQWKDGDETLWTPNFVSEGKFLVDIPDDAKELHFFQCL